MGSVGRAMGGEGRTIHSQAAPLVRPVDAVGWAVLAALCAGGATLLFLLAALARIIVKKKQGSWKKRHNFGVKKSWNQDRTFLSFRKPAPVTIPEKATYLKKSPSPTENKTLPGALSSDPGRGLGPFQLGDLPPLLGQRDHPKERQASKSGERRAPGLSLPSAWCKPDHSCSAESEEPPQNGHHRSFRSLCEDQSGVQQAANHKEEDTRQEENTEPGVQ